MSTSLYEHIKQETGYKHPVSTPNIAAQAVFHHLPQKMTEAASDIHSLHGHPHQPDPDDPIRNRRLIKTTNVMTIGALAAAIETTAVWANESPEHTQRALTFLFDTVPHIAALTALSNQENTDRAVRSALVALSDQARDGHINVTTPMCPPYTYTLDAQGLRHKSGELQPTVGPRFEIALASLVHAFSHLLDQGVTLSIEAVTYTGDGDPSLLVDMGQDVLDFYNRDPGSMTRALRSAKNDMSHRALAVQKNSQVEFLSTSIETTVAPAILALAAQFEHEFSTASPSGRFFPQIENNRQIAAWARDHAGAMHEGWLIFYLDEELKYRRKQNVQDPDAETDTMLSALREGLLYAQLIQRARTEHKVILDLETTPDYMRGALNHLQGETPVIMLRQFDPKNVLHPLKLRQPFNIPDL